MAAGEHDAQTARRRAAQQRAALLTRLERVEAAIRRWRHWQANEARPRAQRRPMTPPPLNLATCLDLRQMLKEELARGDDLA